MGPEDRRLATLVRGYIAGYISAIPLDELLRLYAFQELLPCTAGDARMGFSPAELTTGLCARLHQEGEGELAAEFEARAKRQAHMQGTCAPGLVFCVGQFGVALIKRGQVEQALAKFDEAVTIAQQLYGEELLNSEMKSRNHHWLEAYCILLDTMRTLPGGPGEAPVLVAQRKWLGLLRDQLLGKQTTIADEVL